MATLLPSLSSDEEEEVPSNKKRKEEDDEDDDDVSSSDDEMDEPLNFGGILGEDGGLSSSSTTMTRSTTNTTTTGWSYEMALSKLHNNSSTTTSSNITDDEAAAAAIPQRMDVSSLIAAKRKTIKQQQQQQQQEKKQKTTNGVVDEKNKNDSNNEDDDDDDDENNNNDEDDSGDDDDDDDDDDSSSSSSDDEEEVDDVDDRKSMEADVLKTRTMGKATTKMKNENEDDDDDDKKKNQERDDNSDNESMSDGSDGSDDEDEQEKAKENAFFDNSIINNSSSSSTAKDNDVEEIDVFSQLALSRPVLRGIAAMGFVKPTPIQASVIPLALAGRDICASAVTGSGKTAAFLLPVLEGLLHRESGRIQVVILTPTRELAAQCIGMWTSLSQYTQLRSALIVGGMKNVKAQAAELRTRPDIVIGTPGRLLDHITNSSGVTFDEIEYLILDEADRLLDLGFQDEVHEIIKSCPIKRQTMLFSATMNTKVDDLIQLSLKRPVRVRIGRDDNRSSKDNQDLEVAPRLEQEFIRIRASNEGIQRESMLLSLLTRTFTNQSIIVFFDTKIIAHRFMILCGLFGIQCTELHGNLTQQQRLQALEQFRSGTVNVLLATDLAARGLDIDHVQTVINYEMPSQMETYIHRIGRTARAGRGGRSCTLIGEGRRHMMKMLIRDAERSATATGASNKNSSSTATTKKKGKWESGVIRSRTIPPGVVNYYTTKITELEPHIMEVLQAEAVAKMDRLAEMEAIKAENIIMHGDEIKSRPQRDWFASTKQKKLTKEAALAQKRMIEEKAGTGMHNMNRKKRRRREAMDAFREANSRDDDDDNDYNDYDDTNNDATRSAMDINTKSQARKKKREQAEKQREKAMLTISDQDMLDEKREKQRQSRQEKKKKQVIGQDAVGDGSLFDEERVTFANKKTSNKKNEAAATQKSPASFFEFKQFDPNKKLGKKKGNKSFKSKSKFKRRK